MSAEIKNITQIGIVTGDLYAMVDRYQKLYGIGPWEIRDGKKGFKDEAEDLMVYGKRQRHHLKEHGEGHIHHISILTDNQAFRETMAERGIASVMKGHVAGVETFEYFDTGRELGVKVEIHDLES